LPNCRAPSLLEPPLAPSLDFTHLLTSNEPILDCEVPLIRDIISDSQSRISPLDAHIEALKSTDQKFRVPWRNVYTGRKRLSIELMRQHQSIVSPVRRMPAKVICDILALTWEAYRDTANGPPWYLRHICRFWRHSALSYPTPWSSRHSNPPRAVTFSPVSTHNSSAQLTCL
jgi:hypothetical protein